MLSRLAEWLWQQRTIQRRKQGIGGWMVIARDHYITPGKRLREGKGREATKNIPKHQLRHQVTKAQHSLYRRGA